VCAGAVFSAGVVVAGDEICQQVRSDAVYCNIATFEPTDGRHRETPSSSTIRVSPMLTANSTVSAVNFTIR
jgi:hypothetical protein